MQEKGVSFSVFRGFFRKCVKLSVFEIAFFNLLSAIFVAVNEKKGNGVAQNPLHDGEVNDMTCAFDMCLPCNLFLHVR